MKTSEQIPEYQSRSYDKETCLEESNTEPLSTQEEWETVKYVVVNLQGSNNLIAETL